MSAKIAAALHQVMEKCSYVQKGSRNSFHNYNYASEADLLATLRPAMVEVGLLLIPSVDEVRPVDEFGNTTVLMTYTLAHKDGEVWPHPIKFAGTGNDKNSKGGIGDKGTYKAITGANKYLLFKLFQIETGDEPEGNHEPPPPPERRPASPAQPKPGPRSVERGTPLADARREIDAGTASTVPQGKPVAPVGDPKAWAGSADAVDFLRDARADLGTVQTAEDMRRWMEANRWEHDAIMEHGHAHKNREGVSRQAFLNSLIADAQGRCSARAPVNLRAAG